MRDELREKAVLKRYGKEVIIDVATEIAGDNEVKKVSCNWKSKKGKDYKLIEELEDGMTSNVVLCAGEKKWLYTDHLRAEISLIDMISEE